MYLEPTRLFDFQSRVSDVDRAWLAGFIDGEGCFIVRHPDSPRSRRGCEMRLSLRDDDRAVLEHAREVTGLGNLYKRRAPFRDNAKPQTIWLIASRVECFVLAELLAPDGPGRMRSKKARDFAVWVRALHALRSRDLAEYAACYWEIHKVRKYPEDSG